MNLNQLLQTPIEELTFSVVDTETTGMYPEHNKIMDIGIVIIKNGKILEEWETLIDPEQDVPYWITKYTNLTNNHVAGKPTFDKILPKIEKKLKNTIFVAHNVGFDYGFLSGEYKRHNKSLDIPKLCTVKLGRKLLPQLANAHLDALSDYYQIEISQRHRALPDAQATAAILLEFIEIAKQKYNAKTFFDLDRLQNIKVDGNTLIKRAHKPDLFKDLT